MNRILFERSEVIDDCAVFDGERAQHVLNILHGEVGQVLKTGIVDGPIGVSVIERIDEQGRITVRCVHDRESPPPWVDLLLAPPRPRALKRLLPQLAQMGVRKIVLTGAEKVEKAFWGAQLLKESVYRPLLLAGLTQAGCSAMPVIEVKRNFRHYLERGEFEAEFAHQPYRVVAHPGIANAASACAPRPPSPPVVAIGPEGGWTDDEVRMLQTHGFVGMSLGERILRTDTAAIALLARLMEV